MEIKHSRLSHNMIDTRLKVLCGHLSQMLAQSFDSELPGGSIYQMQTCSGLALLTVSHLPLLLQMRALPATS